MDRTTLCALPWTHFIFGDGQSVRPCCNYSGVDIDVPKGTRLNEVLGLPFFADMRSEMLRGKKIAGCKRCYDQEDGGGSSMRLQSQVEHPEVLEKEPRLRFLEFNLGNLCNLKCRGCNSTFSTKWIQDELALGYSPERIAKSSQSSLDQLDEVAADLTHLKILGGEPFLFPSHEQLLLKLENKKRLHNLSLSYHTNGTVRVSARVLSVWSQLKSLSISFSIDGLKERNDYFREGSSWQKIFENIHWYKKNIQTPKIEFLFHTVVNIYNIHDIPSIDDWLLSEFPKFWLTKDCLVEPHWLNVTCLPGQEKSALQNYYFAKAKEFATVRKRALPYLKIGHTLSLEPAASFSEFVEKDRALNRLRQRDLSRAHPVLAELVSSARLTSIQTPTC